MHDTASRHSVRERGHFFAALCAAYLSMGAKPLTDLALSAARLSSVVNCERGQPSRAPD